MRGLCVYMHEMSDCNADLATRPAVILDSVLEDLSDYSVDILSKLFPSPAQLDEMLQLMPSTPISSSLAVIQPLIPVGICDNSEEEQEYSFDSQGMTKYVRAVNGLLSFVGRDRDICRRNVWLLKHLLVVSIAAQECLQVAGQKSAFYSASASRTSLQAIVNETQKITTFLLSMPKDDDWHNKVTQAVFSGMSSHFDAAFDFVTSLFVDAQRSDNVRDSLVIFTVLQHLFHDMSVEDANCWLRLARRLGDRGWICFISVLNRV